MSPDERPESSLHELALTLAWCYPDVWPRLKREHVADRTGHCQGCCSQYAGAPVWPCRLWVLADEAERATVVRSRGNAPSR